MTTHDSKRRTLGEQICYWRGRRRLTQVELAGLTGLSEGMIKSLEQDCRPNPGFFAVAKIAAALGLSLDKLMNEPKPIDSWPGPRRRRGT
jgi:transcriptional regulator with XRE-family HTH domain